MALFVDRARAACGRDVTDLVTVTEICQRLDGIPLAIELAAAQTRHLQPAEILDRLSDRFALLTGGHRGVARQQTLQATLDWSHDLLTADERLVFRRLAVFRGSFAADAATGVCGVETLGGASLVGRPFTRRGRTEGHLDALSAARNGARLRGSAAHRGR